MLSSVKRVKYINKIIDFRISFWNYGMIKNKFSLFFSILHFSNGWQYWENPLQMASPNKDGIYEFDLIINHGITMTRNLPKGLTSIIDYSPDTRSWTERDPDFHTKCNKNYTILTENDDVAKQEWVLSSLLQWDGKHRKVIMINGKSPADPIVVPLDARVQIRVHNRLQSQAITLHVHGLRMQDRWWQDGVPYLQQCPISPGSIYTYRIIADTPGTHWFHGHLMGDRSMGLMGGFIVMRPNEKMEFKIDTGEMLKIGRQYLGILQDWYPESVEDAWLDQLHGRVKWLGHQQLDSDGNSECIQPENAGPPQTHGPFLGYLRQGTILLNQKGWHNQTDIRQRPQQLSLANFAIRKGENILLRLVNGGAMEEFYVWLDDHEIWVVAADGAYIIQKRVASLLIHSGERYDILIRGLKNPQKSYNLIFETMDSFMANITNGETTKNYGLANLVYENADRGTEKNKKENGQNWFDASISLNWHHEHCTAQPNCVILNCPYSDFFIKSENYICIINDQLENDANMAENGDSEIFEKKIFSNQTFHEIMLNLVPAFNGWFYKIPTGIPYFCQDNLDKITQKCDPIKCDRGKEECRCFHHYEFGLGNIVQITLVTNMNMPHPFHMHGTKFYVMKTGTMGPDYTLNADVQCADEDSVEMRWSNSSYQNGNIPNMNKNPVIRDTAMVPNKGYLVIRFRASNPGWFFAHCHLLYHTMGGMAFAYKVDSPMGPSRIPAPPANLPKYCGFFDGGKWGEENNDQNQNHVETKDILSM